MSENLNSIFTPEIPFESGNVIYSGSLYGAGNSLFIKNISEKSKDAPIVVFTPDTSSALRLKLEIDFFSSGKENALIFPDWETLPYDKFSPHQDIISDRLSSLYKIPSMTNGVIIVAVPTLIQRLPPLEYVKNNSLLLTIGDIFDIDEMRIQFESCGYSCVTEVIEHGEFAVRGSLIDLFPMGSAVPYRIDLFDYEVESIRTFNPETQLTINKVDSISLLPAREFPFDEESITKFRKSFRMEFGGDPKRSPIYNDVSNRIAPAGIEYYLPFFFDSLSSIFDYLPAQSIITIFDGFEDAIKSNWKQILVRFQQLRHDIERPILDPDNLFISLQNINKSLHKNRVINIQSFKNNDVTPDNSLVNYSTSIPPAVRIQARHEEPALALQKFITDFDGKILFCTESTGRQETLLETLKIYKIFPKKVDGWERFLKSKYKLAITVGDIEEGLIINDSNIAIITESQLSGERAQQKRRRKKNNRDFEASIKNLSDLNTGSPVVHIDHGVGRYIGLQTLEIDGTKTEFLALGYANNDKLYVPVSSLHLISRYNGAVDEKAPLNRLGTDQWEKAKKKAAEKIRDVAAELLEIYAKREAKKGYQYSYDQLEYNIFADSFPFEETPDQLDAIESVVKNMASDKPMDMVVCGDVGFGKTEVALRAAFIGVQGGKQVAILVPTTLLAQQHYQNFKDRFADWPVRIEVLSRFSTKKDQDIVLQDMADGKVDIAIGTHKLIQDSIKFKNLGLVIIDEEHRFGVRQKDRFKQLRSEVDILTLTATPIPRTLNMAMSGLRDLAIIATPPAKRLSVKTFVCEWNTSLFQEACLRELKRGGQVYFLHNDVKTIEKITRDLEELIPDANIRFAHGQMRETELEHVMLDFYHQRFNILVSTTIIESGIDIPTANTIIINRADKLGLAQLHQLRGRVGRSHHRAYAYMITPPQAGISADAKKRLEAIESLEDLGAGFMLASHDLEIRGAGELLGDEQSGQISEIGFSLYTELLERAVKALKEGKMPSLEETTSISNTEVDLRIPALIPDDYIPDVHTRLMLYKRIASASSKEEFKELQIEMIDRFGLLPEYAKLLFANAELRLLAENIGISKIDFGPKGGTLLFTPETTVDLAKIIKLIQYQPDRYKLSGQDKFRVTMDLSDNSIRFQTVQKLLHKISD